MFTPDAQAAQDQIQTSIKQEYRVVDPEPSKLQEGMDAVDELVTDPEVQQKVLDELDAGELKSMISEKLSEQQSGVRQAGTKATIAMPNETYSDRVYSRH